MKKALALLIALVMLCSQVSLFVSASVNSDAGSLIRFDGNDKIDAISSSEKVLLGDLTSDKKVKSDDILKMRRVLACVVDFSDCIVSGVNTADITEDEFVNIKDMLFLRKTACGDMEERKVSADSGLISYSQTENAACIEASETGSIKAYIDASDLSSAEINYISFHYKATADSKAVIRADGEKTGTVDINGDGVYHGVILKVSDSGCGGIEIDFSENTASGGKVYMDYVCGASDVKMCERAATEREAALNGTGEGTEALDLEAEIVKIDNTSMLTEPNNTKMTFEDGRVKLMSPANQGDPHVMLNLAERNISADIYKYIVYIYKLPLNNPTINSKGEIFLCAGNIKGPTGGCSVRFDLTKNGAFASNVLNLSGLSYWNGSVYGLRLDYFQSPIAGDVCYLDSIVFCKSASAAEYYSSAYAAAANSGGAVPALPETAEEVRDTLFETGTTDINSSSYIKNGRLCLSAGSADRFTKERLEGRISEALKGTMGVEANTRITACWENIKKDYDDDETAEQSVTCKISYGSDCYMAYMPIGVYVKEVIFDNDLGSDCDDGGAIAMLVKMHRDGYCKVLAITSCVYNPWTPRCTTKICEYFGIYDIKIGENRDRNTLNSADWYGCTKGPAEKYYGGGGYPSYMSNVALIRRCLSESHGNVTFITSGALSTVYALMQSGADNYSPFSGAELFRRNVGHYVCGGGNFPGGTFENNFGMDKVAVEGVVNNYLSGFPITFVGAEVAGIIQSGKSIADRTDYILRDIYLHVMDYGRLSSGYNSWDLGVVYYAIHGTGDKMFTVNSGYTVTPYGNGQITINQNGGCHEYVVRSASAEVLAGIFDAAMVP